MALPHDDEIKVVLLTILARATNGQREAGRELYGELAEQFSGLTPEEVEEQYQNSVSHFANRVQWVRKRLVDEGLMLEMNAGGGRGVWTVSDAGRRWLAEMEERVTRSLRELGITAHGAPG